ncbi:potassium-transporting ATPase subunit KdpC [Dermatophilus congolensis]|uniref:potassium-transporting ATPase subunit KdpC n=10 Tax=Dermatophilus congolensis TaxID=1863 RepID=UPI001AAF9ACB|nr:potassium-transporting ATPase subunit KdpC [Dermatophilus congolensis]MBO3128610.1 potassium-transporting ATPase subunit KdpC [Dermatophilus congolensis]MBO3133086.1 potassium-transporting ATPase subunit KdpC [Dermatophilus congolensis]MBO3135320.1 potassium-transporting ATPase subunit KdpC [Dermatophilus congolensis]MBO3137563.1 potassium-transporting ATPase subunit KdpC [Dermatophilus congolensis]MBO3139806.1 potassium-transporting ATPase subunit KdpC [Dermatophilus congolensis]
MHTLTRQTTAAIKALTLLTFTLGLAWPLTFTGLAQLIAPTQANGSLIHDTHGKTIGSTLLGQPTSGPEWFTPRPSTSNYAANTSGSDNLSPTSTTHLNTINHRRATLTAANPHATTPIPTDALTASGSGLDPHISPEYAHWQAPRIAQTRGIPLTDIHTLINHHTQGRTLGFLGQPRVNVTELNADLDHTHH